MTLKKRPFKSILALSLTLILSTSYSETMKEITNSENDRTNLSITIYNEALALINETRALSLNKGANVIAFKDVSAQIRPETALITPIKGEAFSLIEQNFDYDLLSPEAMLKKAVGQEIEVIKTNIATGIETREKAVVLANNNGVVLKYADRIETGLNGRFAFTTIPDNLRERPTLSVLLSADKQGTRETQLSYLTGGFGWKADYVATLADNEKTIDLSGWITLNNYSGTSFKEARVQLVAGDINQVQESAPLMMDMAVSKKGVARKNAAPMPQQESFSDYHLYTLPFKTTINNQQTKQVALLSTQNVPVEKEYRFQFSRYNKSSGDGNIKAKVYFHIENKEANHLGMPLPKGVFRLYKNSSKGDALFIGEDSIQHTAKNERFSVFTGDAFDVSLTFKQTDFKDLGTFFSSSRYQERYEVIFNNAKDEAVTITYLERFGNEWKILETSDISDKKDAQTGRWTITIPANSKHTLTYTVQIN